MPTMPPDAVADLFDLPPLPPAEPASGMSLEESEAALAAELEAELEAEIASGGLAGDAPDSRRGLRVAVSWPARLRLPEGRVLVLQVRNVSETGVGLVSDEPVPAHTVVDFEMDVPAPDGRGQATCVRGSIRTTYAAAHGTKVLFGGKWQVPPAGLPLVDRWIQALRA